MNLQEAADRLGVHYQTAYRWIRQGLLRAVKVGATYEVEPDEVDRFLAERAVPTPPPSRTRVRNWDAHVERLLQALVAGDEPVAHQVVDRLFEGGVPVAELCGHLIAPVMRTIGEQWHLGELSVAEEHRATAIVERILGHLAGQPRGRPRGTVVVSAAPGDLHTLPSAMAAMALRSDRWRVHHLGANVPAADLVALAARVEADVVVLSLTVVTGDGPDAEVERLRDALADHGIALLVGRPGATLQDLLDDVRAAAKDTTDSEAVG